MHDWISVKNRLPESSKSTFDYIVFDGSPKIARQFKSGENRWIDKTGEEIEGVTHWFKCRQPDADLHHTTPLIKRN